MALLLRSLAVTAVALSTGASAIAPPLVKRAIPALAQVIDQKSFNVLPTVLPTSGYNASSVSFLTPNLMAQRGKVR